MKRISGKKSEKRTVRKREGHSLLYYYMTGYFTVLFIPLFICCIYYSHVIFVISEDDMTARKSELEHGAELVNTMLDELAYLGDSLAADPAVNEFKRVEDAFAYPHSYQVNALQQELPDLYQVNQSVFDYFIFFNNSEMVINNQIAYEYEEFYDLLLREESMDSYEEWYQIRKEVQPGYGLLPEKNYWFRGKEQKEMLAYSRPLLLNGGIGDNSAVVIYVETSVIDTLMPTLPEEGAFLITNRANEILYQKGNALLLAEGNFESVIESMVQFGAEKGQVSDFFMTIGKEKYLTMRLESEQSGLIFYTFLSEKSVNQRKMSVMVAVMFCVACAAVVGMLLSYHMSRKSAVSINDILKEISRETEYYESHRAVFSRLKATYHELVHKNSALADAIEKQKPLIQNAFVNRMIFESYLSLAEAEKLAAFLGIEYRNQSFCVILFRFCAGYVDLVSQSTVLMNSCALSLMEVIGHVMPDSMCVNIGEEQVVLIMNYSQEEKKNYREVTEQMIDRIRQEIPANIAEKMFIYGGNLVDQLTGIHESFHNASYMFRKEKEQIENPVIWYVNNAGNLPLYPPSDMEMKLTHFVTTGDEKGLHDELGRLMTVYIIQNNLPVYLQHMLLNELQITMFRILGTIEMEENERRRYYDLLEENYNCSLLDQITKTLGIYRSVCSYVSRQKEGLDAGTLMPSVVAYIDANYGDCNLSLASVADNFGISEPYLSTVFKQIMGVNFSAYLEGVRIDKAKELLRTTKMLVGEIAERVGYYSANSFCRAFKRVTGSSASEYRKGMKN